MDIVSLECFLLVVSFCLLSTYLFISPAVLSSLRSVDLDIFKHISAVIHQVFDHSTLLVCVFALLCIIREFISL
ncbi:hypothetical protein B0T22DRAFT_468176, partial [Podospora appendiculata]